MPTTIKQLKVINNATLADDGTFSIGLRDNLIIKPNSKVALSKFLYQEVLPTYEIINLEETSYGLTTDLIDNYIYSKKTPQRQVVIPKGIYSNIYNLSLKMMLEANKLLVCGDITSGGTTFSQFVDQDRSKPTIDNGLEILYELNDDSTISFQYNSNMLMDAIEKGLGNKYNMTTANSGSSLIASKPITFWGYSDTNHLVKGAFQTIIQLSCVGENTDWYWGVRYWEDDQANNNDPVRMGLYKDVAGDFYYVDKGVVSPTKINYTWAAGDYLILFTAGGKLYLQGYTGITTGGGIQAGTLKFNSADVPHMYDLYADMLSDPAVDYRMCISSGNTYMPPTPAPTPAQKAVFNRIFTTTRIFKGEVLMPSGNNRVIQMDFSKSGNLASDFGLPSLKLTSPKPEVETVFTGTQTPNFKRVQDLSLFWSLPAHTYVGNQTKTRNGRENLIASFTPTRTVSTTDNLFYQETPEYTDIGNLGELNISSLQFRVVNEYPKGNTKVLTNYLSFTLFIKE